MPNATYLPHIDILLRGMRITRERLDSRSKVAIEAKLLRALIGAAASRMPFDEAFYLASYPDLAEARREGAMPDAHAHFVETGFFEGRVGAAGDVDEPFYLAEYPDVGRAIADGAVKSASDHYVRSGAAEGRLPRAAARSEIEAWLQLLREHAY